MVTQALTKALEIMSIRFQTEKNEETIRAMDKNAVLIQGELDTAGAKVGRFPTEFNIERKQDKEDAKEDQKLSERNKQERLKKMEDKKNAKELLRRREKETETELR